MSKVKMQEILLDFVVKAHIRLHSPLQSIDQHKYMVKDCKLLNEALQTNKKCYVYFNTVDFSSDEEGMISMALSRIKKAFPLCLFKGN